MKVFTGCYFSLGPERSWFTSLIDRQMAFSRYVCQRERFIDPEARA